MSSILVHSLLLAKGILPVDFLRMPICWTAAVFLLVFANWPLSLAVARALTKTGRLIGGGSLSKATNWSFWKGRQC